MDTGPDASPDAAPDSAKDTGSVVDAAPPSYGGIVSIVAETDRTCAVRDDGTVTCWGSDSVTSAIHAKPAQLPGLTGVRQIALGLFHACVLRDDASVACWGHNDLGQLGDPSLTNSTAPTAVVGLSKVTQIAAGVHHMCALLDDGTVACWGWNNRGQIGNGQAGHDLVQTTPAAVTNLSGVVRVFAGGWVSCALLDDATLWCWGDDNYGQLGDGELYTLSAVPKPVAGLADIRSVGMGDGSHVCASLEGGGTYCWGANHWGQLGIGLSTGAFPPKPVAVSTIATAIGQLHTCVLLDSGGGVTCWGDNYLGELGNGTSGSSTETNAPAPDSIVADAVQLAAGAHHTCALKSTGDVFCWGNNGSGQMGDGTYGVPHTEPTPVAF